MEEGYQLSGRPIVWAAPRFRKFKGPKPRLKPRILDAWPIVSLLANTASHGDGECKEVARI